MQILGPHPTHWVKLTILCFDAFLEAILLYLKLRSHYLIVRSQWCMEDKGAPIEEITWTSEEFCEYSRERQGHEKQA